MILELAAAAGLGIALGIVTGMPIAVVNVAIVDAAIAGRVAFATGIGLGGALADTIHAALAFVGVGRVIESHPTWLKAAAIPSAVVILGYALLAWRGRSRPSAPPPRSRGVVTGLVLTLPNPAALAAWIAVAAAVWPTISIAGGIVVALGVGLGSAAWFTALARWVGKRRESPISRAIPRIAVGLLVVLAAAGVIRTFAS